ncbi:MAG: hypothetical protein WA676_14695, partial [Candidatus Sulfotelmatobacter sp.]
GTLFAGTNLGPSCGAADSLGAISFAASNEYAEFRGTRHFGARTETSGDERRPFPVNGGGFV